MNKDQILNSLHAIQSKIINTHDLHNTLLEVQVLAHRLSSSQLKEWCNSELNSHIDTEKIPTYRTVECYIELHCLANHYGNIVKRKISFHKAQLNLDTINHLGKEAIDRIFTTQIKDSISDIESLLYEAKKAEAQSLCHPLPDDIGQLFVRLSGRVYEQQYYQAIPLHSIASIIPKTRSNLLGLILELQGTFGSAEEFARLEERQIQTLAQKTIEQHFHGDVGTVGDRYEQNAKIIQGNQGPNGTVNINNNAPLDGSGSQVEDTLDTYKQQVESFLSQVVANDETLLGNQDLLIAAHSRLIELEEKIQDYILKGTIQRKDIIDMLDPVWESNMKESIKPELRKIIERHGPSLLLKMGFQITP